MSPQETDRVVEMEFQFPNISEIKVPKVDLEPARNLAEKTVIFGIGGGVLLMRGISSIIDSAVRAGEEAAENPGPIASALLWFVGRKEKETPASEGAIRVPVLPIADYDGLSADQVVERCASLDAEQLQAVRDYEVANQNRAAILEAIDRLIAV